MDINSVDTITFADNANLFLERTQGVMDTFPVGTSYLRTYTDRNSNYLSETGVGEKSGGPLTPLAYQSFLFWPIKCSISSSTPPGNPKYFFNLFPRKKPENGLYLDIFFQVRPKSLPAKNSVLGFSSLWVSLRAWFRKI